MMEQQKTVKLHGRHSKSIISWNMLFLNFVLVAFSTFSLSQPLATDALDAISFKAAFLVRELSGQAPQLDERLKIFALDDKTTAMTQMGDFGYSGWSYIVEVLQRRKPKAIVIDKIFALSTGQTQADHLAKTLSLSASPIHVGAYLSDHKIEGRSPLAADFPSYKGSMKIVLDEPEFIGKAHAYGPQNNLLPYFGGVGHISLESNSRYKAIARSADGATTVHLSLLTARSLEWDGKWLRIDDSPIRLDRLGRIPANLVNPELLRSRTMTMASLLKDNEARTLLLKSITPTDIVLLLPQMFTGNTDFKDTAFGQLEGGYILASAINSVLTKEWLSSFDIPLIAHLLISFATIVIIANLRLKTARTLYLGFFMASSLAFFCAFTFFNSYWPALSCIMNVSLIFLPNYFILVKQQERRTQAIIQSLGSSMGQANVERIVDRPDLVLLPPEEKEMTILFLDMVGFSVMSDSASASELFAALKSHLRMIESVVHRNGGIVDKMLGDGVMCFFGFDWTDPATEKNNEKGFQGHAEKAVRCAMELQLLSAKLCIENGREHGIVFPYRIGINTDRCYFGDLGGDERIEFSCIGRGVNFAARLESSADPLKILIGSATQKAISGKPDIPDTLLKKIQIKHYSEFFTVFEINPFKDCMHLHDEAIAAYRQAHKLSQKESRYSLRELPDIRVRVQGMPALLVDISESGFAAEMSVLYGRGVLVDVEIDGLAVEMEDANFRFVAEVKNSGIHTGNLRTGFLIKNLKPAERMKLCADLRRIGEKSAS
jgi:class 3 adenylate cyclase